MCVFFLGLQLQYSSLYNMPGLIRQVKEGEKMNLGIKDFELKAWKCNCGLQQTCVTFTRAVSVP